MAKLRGFSDQATPVLSEFRAGAPAITRATKALGPFAHAATPSLITLGTASAESKQPIANSDPMLIKIRDLAKKAGAGRQGPGHPPQEPPQDRLLQAVHEVPLQHDRRDQRLRPVRPLPPRRAAGRPVLHDPEPEQSGICDAHFNRLAQRAQAQSRRRRPSSTTPRRSTTLAKSRSGGLQEALDTLQAQAAGPAAIRERGPSARRQRACRSTHRAIPRAAARRRRRADPPATGRRSSAARALLDTVIGRRRPRAPGGARDPPRCRRPRCQPDDGGRGHDPDRDPGRLPRLQRQQRPAVRAHLQALRRGAERRHARPQQRREDRRGPGGLRRFDRAGPGPEDRGRSREGRPEARQERRSAAARTRP